MIGQTLSHYRIIAELGRGGMGVVYRAEDTRLNRMVALKFLPPFAKEADEERARFLQEAQAAAALNHPNICTIYRIDEADGKEFIEMELVEGETLRMKIPVREPNQAIEYAIQIAEALQEAHAKGIVHRDIKAENIMVNTRNQVKVMDFGLAKLKGTVRLTKTTSTVGTLAYMAPEQVQGADVDQRSDIFSFGVVLFEMITGHLPFRGEHDAALMYSILNEEPADPALYVPDVSPEIRHILSRTLEKDPGDRYQSAADLIIDLRRVKRDSSRVRRSGVIPVDASVTPSGPQPKKTDQTGLPSGRMKLFGMISLGVALVAALLWYILEHGEAGRVEFGSMKMNQITSLGTAGHASISPDGRYVVHSVDKKGKTSLVIRQIATMSSVEVVPPSTQTFLGTTFSQDGDYLYYAVQDAEYPQGVVKQVPSLGGASTVLFADVSSPVGLSPDGRSLCFIRSLTESGEEALVVARTDGSAERKLASRFNEEFFLADDQGPGWSPDGHWIAAGIATTTGGFHSTLAAYDVETGAERPISDQRFYQIGRVVWLHDGKGVVFAAQENASDRYQLWYASFDDGEVVRLTNDLNAYGSSSLGLTSDDRSLVTLRTESSSSLWLVPAGDPSGPRRISTGVNEGSGGVSWSPDGKTIAFSAFVSSNLDIWSMDLQSGEKRRLTTDPGGDYAPSFMPDGSILFASQSSGTSNIWRMNSEGSNKTRLTETEDYVAHPSPDGSFFLYQGFGSGYSAIWKKPLEGGIAVQLTTKPSRDPVVSPDGRSFVCVYTVSPDAPRAFALFPIDGGDPTRLLDRPVTVFSSRASVRLSRDGRDILFVDEVDGAGNVWSQHIVGGPARQVTKFTEDYVSAFDVSPTGDILCARVRYTSDVVVIEDFRKAGN